MCEPTTIALGVALAGTAVSAYGAYQQGQTQKKIANYNAKVGELNADDAIQRGAIAADQQRAKVRQILGTQRAVMGASGAEVGSGTLGKVLEQTSTLGELDARQIEVNAQREAWGLRTQGALGRVEGDAAAEAGTLNAFGSLLTGGSQAYGIYSKRPQGQSAYQRSLGMLQTYNTMGGYRG